MYIKLPIPDSLKNHMPVSIYTGKSEYCYSNSLHMALASHAQKGWELPEPGFLECLTTMPFGTFFFDKGNDSLFFFDPGCATNPDLGLDHALDTLGWKCDLWIGCNGTPKEELISRLQLGAASGPMIAGPMDLGQLDHNPRARFLKGGDHWVVVLSIGQEKIQFHDPYGYPFAELPIDSFLESWKADSISFKRGPYTLRSNFHPVALVSRKEAISKTLRGLADVMTKNPNGPISYGGPEAVRRLSECLNKGAPESLREILTYFSLPLGARRRIDAARFLEEAGLGKIAIFFEEQSQLLGSSQWFATTGNWHEVSNLLEHFASREMSIIEALREAETRGS